MMRIWVCAVSFMAFVIKHILGQNSSHSDLHAVLGLLIEWVQFSGMLHNVGGGVKLGRGPI